MCVCGGTGGCHCTPPLLMGRVEARSNYSDLIDKGKGNLTPAPGRRSRLTFQPRPHRSTGCPVNAAFIFDLQQKNKIALLSSTHTWVQQAWLLPPGSAWWGGRHGTPAGIFRSIVIVAFYLLLFLWNHHSHVLFQHKENINTVKHWR